MTYNLLKTNISAKPNKMFIKPKMVYVTCKDQIIILEYITIFKITTLLKYITCKKTIIRQHIMIVKMLKSKHTQN
jgi:hypothetical protein